MTDVNAGAAQLLAGRRILVTGGARGLGLAFARHFCEAGAAVAIADIRAELVESAAVGLRASGFTAHALVADLSEPASIERCAGEALALLGGLDGLVNNAAVTDSGGKPGDDIDVETWDRVMNVNVRGTWL
ncbi:MAG: SDR family NAD(P)-dependent oxidoreductase, partial [Proteobacteria bacterium]|nr:SDR family NAD(P)-dependent oxidoreductase [Pseudomonadota bacterium]